MNREERLKELRCRLIAERLCASMIQSEYSMFYGLFWPSIIILAGVFVLVIVGAFNHESNQFQVSFAIACPKTDDDVKAMVPYIKQKLAEKEAIFEAGQASLANARADFDRMPATTQTEINLRRDVSQQLGEQEKVLEAQKYELFTAARSASAFGFTAEAKPYLSVSGKP